ncbi:glycosyltransferase family 4 protein [Cupriavidus sp. AcVe19-1a]|uniref:glycosyltransferase family 4 protein n=1 Tax=Cupriavidus sp. AcVe19-1a TaxID=2821359 RepID=UPI001AE3C5B7|nr:glycosyltransferase family 4 protein [Cupriavidus sp. AcVe19-1a]MBP0628112.1 glycosyltransferase family 4 protein [Cupriavidus sp. AcVe19-1a]
MKLVLFTPACTASAIGGCSRLVAQALLDSGHDVSVVRTESENLLGSESHDFGCPVICWNDYERVTRLARSADALIYQIGNNYEFHCGAVEWLAQLPGIVCLHDFFLGHLFRGWAHTRLAQAREVLCTWYGDEIANRYFDASSHATWVEDTRDIAPMTEWICSMALGVITHSNWGCGRVLTSCAGPVRVVGLAINKEIGAVRSPRRAGDSGQLNILTIGHINPNKRVERVIRAISASPLLRQQVTYSLVGAIQPGTASQLSALATEVGVNLVISGEVDEPTLLNAIEQSDVICCLRWPSLEAASASLIEALLNGKPAVVTDTGFYSEVPDSCVLKVRPENEIEDLQQALELLCRDGEQRWALGSLGQQWARKTFTAENYAKEVMATVEAAVKTGVTITAVDFFCDVMQRWSASAGMLHDEEIVGPLGIFGLHESVGRSVS